MLNLMVERFLWLVALYLSSVLNFIRRVAHEYSPRFSHIDLFSSPCMRAAILEHWRWLMDRVSDVPVMESNVG